MERFSRQESVGYMIMGLRSSGISEKEIKKIIKEVENKMDEWTETVAEEVYDNFYGI